MSVPRLPERCFSLLGALVLLVPAAWPALALPLFDLLRLSALRLARGSRPWIGDRRHLAHRLEAAGLSRAWVLGSLLAVIVVGCCRRCRRAAGRAAVRV